MSFNIEEFFNSIDVIVQERLSDLSYDTTVIATITDDSDKERGHYVVTDGTIRFDAYVNDMNYKTGDQVRVTIMNGDWSQKKFIVGLYTDNGTGQAVTYIPPLGNVYSTNFSKTTASLNSNTSFTLYANGEETYKPVWGKQITKDSSEYILQANGVYNVITLSGDFQTELGALSAGGYGLKLELYIQPEVNSTDRIMKFITFDSSEMIGNPYTFVIDSRQDKQFAIAEQGIVTEIILSVYQGVQYDDKNNSIDNRFKDVDGIELINNGTQYPIHFRNISVGFGSNLTEIEDNTLKIYTTNSTTYKWNNGQGDETNNKHLGLVWLNKDELDGYIGFSDGIYDPSYDEIAYLRASYADTRLTRNAGKGNIADDELSLTLAANIEDSEPYMQNVYKALTTDLAAELQALGRQLTGWPTLQTELNKFISAWKEGGKENDNPALLSDARTEAETAVENLASLYYDVLQHGYNLQNNGYKTETERTEAWSKIIFPETDYYTQFSDAVTNILNQLKSFFDTMKAQTEIGQPMSGYRTVYSNYYNRAKIVMDEIKLNLSNVIYKSKVYGVEKTDSEWLRGFNSRTDGFPSYVKDEKEFEKYANRYCIYWYRYNEKHNLQYIVILSEEEWNVLEEKEHSSYIDYKAACEKNNDEYEFGQFLGNNWERVQVDSSANPISNFGLPEAGETIDGVQYLRASSPTELLLDRRMEPTTEVEKYQVVLFYNHEMCKSNTLTFTNLQASEIPSEFAVDAADILRIEHDTYSQDHYQAYTQANDLVNVADESRIRQLKCYYEGVLCGDEALAGADIFWYIPTNSTMLTYNRKYLIDQGFSTDDVEEDENGNTGKTEYSKSGYVYFSRTIGYENTPTEVTDSEGNVIYDATGNAITEDHITINESDKYFFYKIKPYYEAAAQNNTILVEAHIKKGNKTKITTGEIPFTFSTFGTNGTKYTLVMVPNTTQISTFPHSDTNPNPNLTLELSLRDADNKLIPLNEASVVVPSVIGGEVEVDEENTPAIETYNLQLSWRTHNAALQNSGLTLTPVGEDKTTYTITISNPAFGTTNVPYMGVLNASVMFNEELSNGEPRQIRLKTFYPVSYSSAVEADYYISGPTTIVYDNQGVVSRLTDGPYRLYQHTLDEGDVEVTNCTWELAYFKANGSQLVEGNTEESEKTYKELIAYMPKLNADNTLMPAPMYCALYDEEDKETFVVPVAVCKINGNVVWTQPITITQNNYASSTLNEWNGEFEINEANGTILSTMVGAGRKNVDNQFEGVLMGDIERGANFDTDNAFGLGLYGFHNGAQSFYFGVDGKAFLGKAGRGRINFDGESGTISSASYQSQRKKNEDGTYVNNETAGMLIDLDDGFIDIKGTAISETQYSPKVAMLSEDEYKALWTDNGEEYTGDYEQYKADFEKDATKVAHKQAHIRLDVKGSSDENDHQSPYFLIHSAHQTDEQKHLMFVGDNDYYLQTDNYKATQFNGTDRKGPFTDEKSPGAGFKLDLKKSLLDAYNLKITSKNLFLNSTGDGDPYFVIKSDDSDVENESYRNLMYVDNTTYYLQSVDFKTKDIFLSENAWNNLSADEKKHSSYTEYRQNLFLGSGMKLTLRGDEPGIEAYNFNLRAGDAGFNSIQGKMHEIIIQDKSPYILINTKLDNGNAQTLACIGNSSDGFYFQSDDFVDETASTSGKGMRISISGHELKAYAGFKLKAYQQAWSTEKQDYIATLNYVLVDSTADEKAYPIRVTDNFKVSWNGSIEATGGTFTNINAVGGNFQGINVTGDFTSGTISGSTIYASALYAGGANAGSSQSTDTQLVATTDGVTIKNATIQGGNVSGTGAYYGLSSEGVLTGRSATLEALTITKTATFTDTCQTTIHGNLGINIQAHKSYDLYVKGISYFKDHIGIGTKPDENYTLTTNGDIYVGGSGSVYVGGKSTFIKPYSNGIWFEGNLLTFNTSYIQVGQGSATTEMTFLNGSTLTLGKGSTFILGTGSTAYFQSPENIVIGEQTLPQYIDSMDSFSFITIPGSNTKAVGYAVTAQKIGDSASVFTSLGNATTPVYLENGKFILCDTYPSSPLPAYSSSDKNSVLKVNSSGNLYWGTDNNTTYDLSSYATQTWVNNNFCGVSGTTINRIKARLKALDGLDS